MYYYIPQNQQANKTRMVVQIQLVEPAVCFSDLLACEELIHSLIRQMPNNIMLRQQTRFNTYEPKISVYDIYLASNHFIVCPSSVTLTFNLPEQIFQT